MKIFNTLSKKAVALRKKGIPIPTGMGIFLFFLGTLCSRTTLLGLVRPFGGAFFAAIFKSGTSYIYMLCAILGHIFSPQPLYDAGKYLFAMTFYALLTDHLPEKSRTSPVIRGCVFAFCLSVSSLFFIFAASRGIAYTTPYDLMLLFIEVILASGGTMAFSIALPIIKKMKLSYSFSSIEEISLVAFFGCALCGIKDISDIGIINIANVICILIILVFAVRLGTGRGVIAGLTMGLVSAMGSGIVDLSVASYAFSALAASLAGSLGALPACSAFILANALFTALANGSTEVLISIFDIFTACIIYTLIPERFLLRLTSFGTRDEKDRLVRDERSFSEYILESAKSSVDAIGRRMTLLNERRLEKSDSEKRFLERLAKKGCTSCGMRRTCWGRDINKTIAFFKNALEGYITNGRSACEPIPANCLRPDEICDAFSQSGEIYRLELIWQGKIKELSEANKKQMEAFSQILSCAIASLAHAKSFDRALADDIARKLADGGIAAHDIVAIRDEDFDPTIILTLEPCGGFSLCEKGVPDIISSSCGRKMVRIGKQDCKSCRIKYAPDMGGSLNAAISAQSRNNKYPSGDLVRLRLVRKGLYAAILCDGMGWGEKASAEARSAAEALFDLIENGVDGESAMKIVNALLIPAGEVTFSTADLLLYDAANETAQIIKCGSAASFTKSGDRVDALYSKNMPLGSVIKNDIETFTLSAKEGDIIVMISDGVLEGNKSAPLRDAWLIGELESYNGNDPKQLTDLILKCAMERSGSTSGDDITVFAAFVE